MIPDMTLTFMILITATVCFMISRFRADLVSLGALLALMLTGILTVGEALAGFANSIVIMIAALFIVGEGIFQTGLAKRAGNQIVRLAGQSETRLLIIMMIVVAVLSGFMSNTGTVAVLLPIVVSLCSQLNISPGRMLIPLAFASSMGGVLTLIGTAPNLVASQTLAEYGYERLSFFDYTPIGLLVLTVGILYMIFVGRRMLPDRAAQEEKIRAQGITSADLAGFYKLSNHFHRVRVPDSGPMVGATLADLQLPDRYGITVLEIERKEDAGRSPFRLKPSAAREPARARSVIEGADVLFIQGAEEAVRRFMQEHECTHVLAPDELGGRREGRIPEGLSMVEVLLTPQSSLINQTVEEAGFREKYALNVLAVNRKGKYTLDGVAHQRLQYGDALLAHGSWERIRLLAAEQRDVVVLRHSPEPVEPPGHPVKAAVAGVIMLLMLGLMTFEIVPAVTAVLIAAMLMIVTGCLRSADDAYRAINWQSVVLIAAMLPMATALEKTGGVAFISDNLVAFFGQYGPVAVMAGLYLLTSLFSQFISNTATAVLFAPVAVTIAQQMGVSPYPLVLSVAVAASMAFATPVASPPNAMVMTAGNYTFADFVKTGVPLQLLLGVIVILALPLFFPL